MLFHEAIARALADWDVEAAFGVIGDGNMYLVDSFVRLTDGKFYSMSHEAGAVLAANGYARSTGGLGVATVTHGPALTNTLTALVESVRERTPVLLVAGDTAVVDRDNFQNIDQREAVVPTGAGFEQVRSVDTVCEDVAAAVRRALTEQRPVVLNVPIDLQWQQAAHVEPDRPRWAEPLPLRPPAGALDDALGIVASSRRPVVLAGRGAWREAATAAVSRFAHRIGAPLATTLRARDLFRGDPHDLGIHGTLSHEVALDVITKADCLVSFGASLNKWTTAKGSLLDGKAVVQVDAERSALGKFQAVEAMVHGDSGAVAEDMVGQLKEAEIEPTGYASPELAERLVAQAAAPFVDRSTEKSIDIRTAIQRIDAAFPRDRSLVFDVGRFILTSFTMFHVKHPRNYHHAGNFGSIGLGMGSAIGAAVVSGKPTLLVTGDGGFMLGGLAEFNTAVRHGLDLVVVVLNDRAYGAEHVQFRDKGMDPTLSTFAWPDFGPVADALGGRGYTVRNLAELDAVLPGLPERDRPVLIDVWIDPDRVPIR